jgi:hypothetical protein
MMENQQSAEGPPKKDRKFRLFAVKKIITGTVGVLALLWIASYVVSLYETHDTEHGDAPEKAVATRHAPSTDSAQGSKAGHAEPSHDQDSQGKAAASQDDHQAPQDRHASVADEHQTGAPKPSAQAAKDSHATANGDAHEAPHADTVHDQGHQDPHAAAVHGDTDHDTPAATEDAKPPVDAPADADHGDTHQEAPTDTGHAKEQEDTHAAADHGDDHADADHEEAHGEEHGDGHMTIAVSDKKGVTFVMATIAPLRYELDERFYGWRPNDVIRPADNILNYQLGVLEVTRRTVEALTERISRTGSAQAYDTHLEKARNNLAINADDYMMPSAEASYTEALDALERYKGKLERGSALFFTRTVNLIPLLESFENLLGGCDDNLVKAKEDDGSQVSWFRADDYFYYTQGVAKAMHTILQAVAVDFARVVESRRGDGVLHHAMEALHHAIIIEPLIILDGDPDGFTANHRANLAAPISHARFYVALLIQTLST